VGTEEKHENRPKNQDNSQQPYKTARPELVKLSGQIQSAAILDGDAT